MEAGRKGDAPHKARRQWRETSEGKGQMGKRDKKKVGEACRAKAKKPQRAHQRKVVKNHLGMRMRPAHCTACTAFDEHATETGFKTVDTRGKVAAEILCTFCAKQPIPWRGSPAMSYACEWEHDAYGNYRAFHGTAYCFVQDILRHGLQPKRESGMVYFSPYVARAETYAKSWAVGIHACGVTDELRACVLWFSLPEDEAYSQEDAFDFSVARSVAHSELSEEILIDLSGLSPETSDYIGYLQSFATIVGFHLDPYREEKSYLEMHKRAQMRFNELRESVSPVVFFRSRYVPKA